MPKLFVTLWLALLCQMAVLSQSDTPASQAGDTLRLLEKIEVYLDSSCSNTLEEVLLDWEGNGNWHGLSQALPIRQSCHWARLLLKNPDSIAHTRALYFPKGWQHLECFLPRRDRRYERKNIGTRYGQEILRVDLPPLDTLALYVRYPEASKAYNASLNVREITEEAYLRLRSRTKLKFLLIGVLIFPILYFLLQFLVQKDKLSFYYLLFLVGASAHMLTILDTIPFFELSPKLMPSMGVIKRLFVLSTLITLGGLVKYIHTFLDVSSWSPPLIRMGHILLAVFLGIVLIPMAFPRVFHDENYISYLPYFRIWALLLFMYILTLSIWAILKKIDFSLILLFAFFPLVISGVLYSSRFVFSGGFTWLTTESLILITGFLLTLLLFGVVLGVRNNAIKEEKVRLEQQTRQWKELDQFKSRFYTNITHEFRTPLTVIKGMSGQIEGNEKIKTLIQRNSGRLLNMVNQLLDLSRLESNSLAINWVQGDVVPYLQYLTESCHSLANDKHINLAFFSKADSLVMDYDETKLQHILINLLSNAIKFTPEYGSVKVTAAQVLANGKPFLELMVSDTGKGIPKEKLPHIFDRFYQVDDSATRQGEGSGIGLALVKELVQLLEGSIEVESEIGPPSPAAMADRKKGTKFIVLLPARKEAPILPIQEDGQTAHMGEQRAPAIDSTSALHPAPPGPVKGESAHTPMHESTDTPIHKPMLLIIEDNTDVTEYIISCLNEDYALQTARNGKEGVEKALESVPDVILCDVMMPEMDGFEACRILKSERSTSHIPIVLLTAKATQEDKVAGLSQGADAYLTKPFDKEELLVRLKNLAGLSKRLRERLADVVVAEEEPSEQEQREAAFLQELHQIIETNMGDESFDTNRLCRAIAMSRTQLHRKLKALTGQATASFIRSIRLRKAKALLETTDLPIGDIAVQVGYKDASHFSRSFGKEFGVLPSEVRKST